MRLVNLFNGDCAFEEWQKCRLPGEALVWRESYLWGPLPPPGTPWREFNRLRAPRLHAGAPEIAESDILAELDEMHNRLFSLGPEDRLILWFDHCPFDRTMLSRILALLADMPVPPQTELICADVVWDQAAFKAGFRNGIRLGADEFAVGQSEWSEYLRGKRADELLSRLISPTSELNGEKS